MHARISKAFGWYGGTSMLLKIQAECDAHEAEMLAPALDVQPYGPTRG